MRCRWVPWLTAALPLLAGCAVSTNPLLGTRPPCDRVSLNARLDELRAHYAPFLRSLPKPLPAPERQSLDGDGWISKYELAAQTSSPGKDEPRFVERPPAPDFFRPDLDEQDWQSTSVPEWNYGVHARADGHGAILWYRKHFTAAKPPPDRRVWLVFEGVDWWAEVWLNGKLVGEHAVYHEGFRFDVTDVLAEQNVLAVRVTSGRRFGEPAAYWTVFPVPFLREPKPTRYTLERANSLAGFKNSDSHIGDGYGIHRSVYLENTGPVRVAYVLARGNATARSVVVAADLDVVSTAKASVHYAIMPENFEGETREWVQEVDIGPGITRVHHSSFGDFEARLWTPQTPFLYRARVSATVDGITTSKDAVFGFRAFEMVTDKTATPERPEGMFLLNGQPIFLRGANIQGLNALHYWGERDRIIDILLMLHAANFNAVRACQHVCFPEVLELMDRLGMMSEQDQGTRGIETSATLGQLELAAKALARETYNNPGVVLLSFANECSFDPTSVVRATLQVDPERIIAPISGQMENGRHMWIKNRESYPQLPEEFWSSVVNDVHQYWGWYGAPTAALWQRPAFFEATPRMLIVGEYGSEALDNYETMRDHYPKEWKPVPAPGEDRLWGQSQVEKADRRQIFGFRGQKPHTLEHYIDASQTYQADQLTEVTRSWRLSPRKVAGYFQFHFVDALPANWPKAIVSFDLTPKKAYYAMAQLNQPVVPLPFLKDGQKLSLWVANDTDLADDHASIRYVVRSRELIWTEGSIPARIRPYDAVEAGTISVECVSNSADRVNIELELRDAWQRPISTFAHEYFFQAWRQKDAALTVGR